MKNKRKAFALPLSLLLLVVMSIMGATLVSISSGDIRANDEKDSSQQTFYAAESGITHAKRWMKINTNILNGAQGTKLDKNNILFCNTNFFPNFNGTNSFRTQRKTLSEVITGNGQKEVNRLKNFSFEYFISYSPNQNGNNNSAIKKPGTNKTYYTIYSCGCDARKIDCKTSKNEIVALEAVVTLSSQ